MFKHIPIKVEKKINKWRINLNSKNNISIIITIKNNDNYSLDYYESLFNLHYFHSFDLFKSKISIKEIIEFISDLFDKKQIQIENENKEKLYLIIENNPNILLTINKKVSKIITNKEINILEDFNPFKKKKKTKFHLTQINSINAHTNWIRFITSFPSGNIISVSYDKTIKIYDIHFNIIQLISKSHNDYILYIDIKDDNNFISCSWDKSIKIWIKNKEKLFIINQIIENAHNGYIYKVLYYLNENIISCSNDGTVKIWEKNINNNKYQLITSLKHSDTIRSILILNNKNILISSGSGGTKFWNINNFESIVYIKNAFCCNNNALKRIDDDKIIVGGRNDGRIKIISIFEKGIIKSIENNFLCCAICIIENKKLILIGGESNNIIIYRSDNFDFIQIIKDIHNDWIYGITKLNNGLIITYGCDKIIKVWIL